MAGPLQRWLAHLRPLAAGRSAVPGNFRARPTACPRVHLLESNFQPPATAENARQNGHSSNVTALLAGPTLQCRIPGTDLDACKPGISDLNELEGMIDEARKLASIRRKPMSARKPDADGKWLCCSCQAFLPACNFYSRVSSSNVPIRSSCVECERKQNQTLRRQALQLVYSARSRSKRHSRCCNLTVDDVLDMLFDQKGRCAYSGVVMEILHPNSHWRWTLERKDNRKGYSKDNCVLLAAEFNTSDYSRHPGVLTANVTGTAQWSAEKVRSVFGARSIIDTDLCKLEADLLLALFPTRKSTRPFMRDRMLGNEAGEFQCARCELHKPPTEFSKNAKARNGLFNYCKCCSQQTSRDYRTTLRGLVFNMTGLARRRSRLRHQSFDLDCYDVLGMLYLQGGRCYYSGVPLQYRLTHADWRISLERLDNSVGYTKANCVLTTIEFNTPDYSRNKARAEVQGTAQWSRAKAEHVWGHIPIETSSGDLLCGSTSGEQAGRAIKGIRCKTPAE
ncbi:unnamed protein product [Polarella glacialis]|uniref:Uncharacterized protein n=1 Tax=Polarella glacialis TaxID=89957 RepID=A0A813DGA1_POLGL|nr:unnamed protein product [Polarella glacialis]